ncbi:DUF3667 domain-containing protein [uncultured Croceitalea sp.]|uniref:DUF3667 domain-containing protein n=1 Tax=uncultured Croceitalea sp. TaxID=1798908 RepID=UPI003305DEC9
MLFLYIESLSGNIILMTHCLNCSKTVSKDASFCSNCGAKIVKERITLKRILSEVVETIFGWDNKYFFTVRSLVLKPHVVLEEYVSGIRKRYVHPFTFLIIGATLMLFSFTFFLDYLIEGLQGFNADVISWLDQYIKSSDGSIKNGNNPLEDVQNSQEAILRYFNVITMALIPVYALFTYLIYRKKYNYAEHLVFNCYLQGTSILLTLIVFYISLVTHPMVYITTSYITILLYLYTFGKLLKLGAGQSIIKLLLFIVALIIFNIIALAILVGLGILITYLKT